jgi:hypothetical protein
VKWRNINTGMLLNSLANVGRSLVNPLFIAAISYLFIRMRLDGELQSINKISVLINLLLVFSGWGLKDYLVKESARPIAMGPGEGFKTSWHLAFYSKLLLLVPLVLVSFIVLPAAYSVFVVVIAILRTYNVLYEPLVILHKKNLIFFIIDLLSALTVVVLIFLGIIRSYDVFFFLLAASELVKVLIGYFVFRLPEAYQGGFRAWLSFLKETRFYFLLVLVSFFQSRVDLYVLGFLFSPGKLNEYQLLSSLLSLSQVIIAAYVVSYSKLLYRNIHASERAFRRLLLFTGSLVAVGASGSIYLLLNYLYPFHFSRINALIVAWNVLAFSCTLYEMYYYTKLAWLNKVLVVLLLSGLLNFTLCMWLISPLGITGALLANTCSITLLGLLMFWRRNVNRN